VALGSRFEVDLAAGEISAWKSAGGGEHELANATSSSSGGGGVSEVWRWFFCVGETGSDGERE
jgi:hypothetical protein